MFWNNLIRICNENNTTPSAVTSAMGLAAGSVTKWKNGSIPRDTTLKKIADYFGVPVSVLTGPAEPIKSTTSITAPENEKESRVLLAYRSQPEMQPAVDKILGISDSDDFVTVYAAAKSSDNHPPQMIKMPREQWDRINSAPETDEDLI